MIKTVRDMLIGGALCFVAALSFSAYAVVGTPPIPATGPGLVDGTWLNGLASGQNFLFQNGLTAVGTNQATALQLVPGSRFYEIDTSGSGGGTGIALPPCVAGAEVSIVNNTAYTIDIYPAIANNALTAAQDTIQNTTSTSQTTYTKKTYVCAKNGVWMY